MKLPQAVANLVKAQHDYDSIAYTGCFSETAVVFDEGHTYTGKTEIRHWIAEVNEKYKPVMTLISFEEKGTAGILTAENSGTFPGSPIVLKYHFEINDGLIQSLKITG